MDNTLRALALALVAVFGVATGAEAQLNFSAEVRGDFTFPTDDLDDAFEVGAGFTGDLYLDFHETFSAYAGYNWNKFSCDEEQGFTCGEDPSISGFELGLRAKLPVAERLGPWARAGVLFHKFEVGDFDTDRETGFQVGIGLDFPLGDVVSVVPAFHYNSVGFQIDPAGTGVDEDADATWWGAGVGLRFTFGG